jgi:hypothetical protein
MWSVATLALDYLVQADDDAGEQHSMQVRPGAAPDRLVDVDLEQRSAAVVGLRCRRMWIARSAT